jgi:hypothetical protein
MCLGIRMRRCLPIVVPQEEVLQHPDVPQREREPLAERRGAAQDRKPAGKRYRYGSLCGDRFHGASFPVSSNSGYQMQLQRGRSVLRFVHPNSSRV